jgi:hypothetical protein
VLDAAERAGRAGVLAGGEGGDSEQSDERRRAEAADERTGAQSVLLGTEVTRARGRAWATSVTAVA